MWVYHWQNAFGNEQSFKINCQTISHSFDILEKPKTSPVRKKFPIMVLMFPYNFTSFALEVTKIVKLPFQSSLDSSITSVVRNNNFEGCYNKIVVLWPYDIFLFYFSYFLFCLQWQCSRRSFSHCRSYTSFSVCTVSVEEQEFILKWKQFSKNLSTHVHLKAKTILQESKYTCLS